MARSEPGDYVKAEFRDERGGESEWMWVRVESADDEARVVFGRLVKQPVAHADLQLGEELAVSYDNVCEHLKAWSFGQ